MKNLRFIYIVLALAFFAPFLRAETKTFDVLIDNVALGALIVTHDLNGADYEFSVEFEPVGFIGALTGWDFKTSASGLGTKFQRYLPRQSETTIRGRDIFIDRQAEYEGDTIRLAVTPYVETNVDPASAGDAVDWATALAYAFRNQSPTRICKISVPIYEGDYLMRIILSRANPLDATRVRCAGAIRLEEGFERTRFQNGDEHYFAAIYRLVDSGEYTLDRALINSPLGEITIVDRFEPSGDESDLIGGDSLNSLPEAIDPQDVEETPL